MKVFKLEGKKIIVSLLILALYWIVIWYTCFLPQGFHGMQAPGCDYREVSFQDSAHVPLWENVETGEVYERTFTRVERFFMFIGPNVFLKPMTSSEVFVLVYDKAPSTGTDKTVPVLLCKEINSLHISCSEPCPHGSEKNKSNI